MFYTLEVHIGEKWVVVRIFNKMWKILTEIFIFICIFFIKFVFSFLYYINFKFNENFTDFVFRNDLVNISAILFSNSISITSILLYYNSQFTCSNFKMTSIGVSYTFF